MSLVEIKVPSIGESVTEVTLARWLVKEGDIVKLDQILCEFESDKATFELPSEAAGKISLFAKEKDDLIVGTVVAQIDTSSAKIETPITPISEPTLEKENGSSLTVNKIPITDKEDQIEKKEIYTTKQVNLERLYIDESRGDRKEKMSRMRRTISKRLVAAKNETAMLTTFNEMDMSAIQLLRKNHNDAYLEKYGVKLGFMSLFAKACSIALMEWPDVNAFIDDEEIIYHDYVDISFAISTPNGLVVPPIKNIQNLKLHEIELQLKVLAEKARSGKLSIQEMSGGTFTITNGGVFGSLMSTPIINQPQSAILGMHAIKDRPIAIEGKIEIRPMMYLALSYDHRIIDGSTSVTFLVRVKELLEEPLRLLLD
ncbi:MAG: dihydrolipoyllysine-residue succinyltransferase [Saprospiraceae bacterium]|nr:dihydrolipoyllysine-residue succinyltransferase [Saprospiraceae bacterium]